MPVTWTKSPASAVSCPQSCCHWACVTCLLVRRAQTAFKFSFLLTLLYSSIYPQRLSPKHRWRQAFKSLRTSKSEKTATGAFISHASQEPSPERTLRKNGKSTHIDSTMKTLRKSEMSNTARSLATIMFKSSYSCQSWGSSEEWTNRGNMTETWLLNYTGVKKISDHNREFS